MTEEKKKNIIDIIESHYDFSEFTPEEKEKSIQKIVQTIHEATMLEALENSGDETARTFVEMMEGVPDEKKVRDFIRERLPNFETIFEKKVAEFFKTKQSEQAETRL